MDELGSAFEEAIVLRVAGEMEVRCQQGTAGLGRGDLAPRRMLPDAAAMWVGVSLTTPEEGSRFRV